MVNQNQQTAGNIKSQQPRKQGILSILSLGGREEVTKNMYVYEYENEILLVECGIGFADETMLGVDLLLPDISYLLDVTKPTKGGSAFGGKRIVGMVMTHGHEDHIGAIPFIIPQLSQQFPIFASPLTASLTNEKLRDFRLKPIVKAIPFDNPTVKIGSFSVTFIHVTHSVPDSASLFIETPAGNVIHTGDFKFDFTPYDGKQSDFARFTQSGQKGVMCLVSDCLGSEKAGHSGTEKPLAHSIEEAMKNCKGKFIMTTYSSHVARWNQALDAAKKLNRKVCFVGRSLIKVKDAAITLGYMSIPKGMEVEIAEVNHLPEHEVLLFVAGSQGQENSALSRIANNEHKELSLSKLDTVLFSSDPIPGNEVSVTALVDTIAKKGVPVLYSMSAGANYHVSGHGHREDLQLMIALTKPVYVMPTSGNYKHMVAYKQIAKEMGYSDDKHLLTENGQEVIFENGIARMGKKIESKTVFVDRISGEEVDQYVLRDREKLAKEGVVIIMAEVNAATGQLLDAPSLVTRGFSPADQRTLSLSLPKEIASALHKQNGRVTNWVHLRKTIGDLAIKHITKALKRQPLILPVIIEV
jgi:ribonuclease J